MAGWLATWPSGGLALWVAGWLATWVAEPRSYSSPVGLIRWLGGWVAGWLADYRRVCYVLGMIIATTNSKGGVGKSTIAVHLAVYLQRIGKQVLVIDCDMQRSCSGGLTAWEADC